MEQSLKRSKGDDDQEETQNQPDQPVPGPSGVAAGGSNPRQYLLLPKEMPLWAEQIVKNDISREQQQAAMREQHASMQNEFMQMKDLLKSIAGTINGQGGQALPTNMSQTVQDVTMQTVASQPTGSQHFNTQNTEVRDQRPKSLSVFLPVYPAEGLTFESWMQKFKMCVEVENWSVKDAHARVVITCGTEMTDNLKDVDISLYTMQGYFNLLQQKFGRKPMTAHERHKELSSCHKQKNGESFKEFGNRIRKSFQQCQPGLLTTSFAEDHLMMIFRNGLNDKYYKKELVKHDVIKPLETLDQCVSVCESFAEQEEEEEKPRGTIQELDKEDQSVDVITRKSIVCRFCKKKGHIERNCWKKNGKPTKDDKKEQSTRRRQSNRGRHSSRGRSRGRRYGKGTVQELSETLAKVILDAKSENEASDSSDNEKDF